MKGFDNRFLDELKAKSDIVEVVSKYMPLESRVVIFGADVLFITKRRRLFV